MISLPSARYPCVAYDLDALGAVFLLEELRNARGYHTIHDAIREFQNRHFTSHVAASRGCFKSDVAAADDHYARVRFNGRLNGVGVSDAAQIMHSWELGAGACQAPRRGAEAQQQSVVGQCFAVGELYPAGAGVDRRGLHAQFKLDPMLIIKGLMPKRQPVGSQLAGQVLFG
jgi:hypothetical protein